MNVIFAKILTENFSDQHAARLGFLTNAGIACGISACLSLGVLLPEFEDIEANKLNETWRIIFMTPAMIGFFVMLMLLCVYKEDTITYCIQKGLKNEAKSVMKKIYRLKATELPNYTFDDVIEAHYNYLRENTNMEASETTIKQVIFDRKFLRSTWVCFFINCLCQLTGMNVFN